jgi:hypothetical protein
VCPPVLTRLVSTSLHDDLYGVVQRDIPKIIEALLSYLSAVEEFEAELKRRETALRESEDRERWEREGSRYDKAGKVVGGVRDSECFILLLLRILLQNTREVANSAYSVQPYIFFFDFDAN